jgi:hypothetical protein
MRPFSLGIAMALAGVILMKCPKRAPMATAG